MTDELDMIESIAKKQPRYRELCRKKYLEIFKEAYLEGFMIGYLESLVRTRRRAILSLLSERFGRDAVATVKEPLEKTHDKDRLLELFDLAAHCADLSEFRRELPW